MQLSIEILANGRKYPTDGRTDGRSDAGIGNGLRLRWPNPI